MEHPVEKRRDERFACTSEVEWGYFNKPDRHGAHLRNFSHAGACFESAQAVLNGASIMMKLEQVRPDCRSDCTEKSACPWPRLMALGEVKWCRDLSGSGAPRFGVGVKFHNPP